MSGQWNLNGYEPPPRIEWTPPKKRRTGLVVTIVAGLVVLLAAAVVLAVVLPPTGDDAAADPGADATTAKKKDDAESTDDSGGSAARVEPGNYRVVHVDTELCLTTGPEIGNKERDVIVLGDCDKTYPEVMAWESAGDDRYTVNLPYTKDNWNACLTADGPADDIGYLFAGQNCEDDGELQTFELTERDGGKYGITVAGTGMCVGPLQVSAKKGTALSTVKCSDDKAQSFGLEKV